MAAWQIYVQIYVLLTLLYLWYRFIMLFIVEMKAKHKLDPIYNDELISVLVPFYNEKPDLLRRTLESLLAAQGNKEIIVIDDGSPNKACATLVRKEFPQVLFVRYEGNRGKRLAQKEGFLYASGDFIVTVDSDTVLHKDALVKIVEPLLRDKKVGAATGNVQVLNQNENMLTKMIAARYWNAFNLERKSLSHYGIVTCCSGVLSSYRTELFMKFMPAYTNQKFLGVECTYGDDRHLTNLILRDKHKIVYVDDAICYTEVPTKYKQFFKQQLRWKKSFLRESLITLQFAFKHSFLLTFEVLINLIIPFWSLAIRLALILAIIMYPMMIFAFAASVITIAVMRNYFLFWENKKLAFYAIPYAFVHEFGLFWLYFVALFTLREKGWGTR